MRFTVSMHEIEPKALKAPLAACRYTAQVLSLVSVYVIYGRGRITAPGRFPYSFRVAQTGTKPFSLTAPGSDRHPGIEPGPHW